MLDMNLVLPREGQLYAWDAAWDMFDVDDFLIALLE
jgi:hypothetical protein